MYSFARHNHGLAWVTLSAISLFVHGCGSMSADNPAGNGAAAGTESVSPASDTLFSTIQTPDFGRYDLVARGPDDGSGEWQFAVRSGRGAPVKNELRFVWDFGDGKTYQGVEQSYSFTTNGSYVIKVTAIKLDGTVAFILTLNVEVAIAVNEPPIADAGTDQTADANALVFLYGGASSDPDGDPLTYRWVQISGEPVLLLHANEPTASFIAPSSLQDADLVFGVTVGDGGYNAQDSVVVRVLKLVQPAALLVTADAGADQLNVLQGTPVTLDGSGSSSSNGSPLTYAWSWSPLPGTDVTLQPTTDPAIVTFTAPGLAQGETSLDLFFELVVSAGDQSASDEVRVTVTSESLSGGTVPVPPVPTEPCVTSSPTWQNMSLTSQSGSFEFQFDAVPNNANMDGIVALSQGAGATFADYAVIVRFDLAGSIDIRDGATYAADASVPYSAGTNYHFRVLVNGPARTYNVYVTPEGGTQETLATDYAFRSEQSSVTSLANWAAWSDTGGSMEVCNAVLAVVALTASAGPDVIMAPGGAVTLSGSASGGELPYTYRWSPTTGLDDGSAAQPTARPSATTTYTLTVTDNVGASAGDSVVVTVQNAPLAAGAGPDLSVQPGGSITLQGSASGGAPPYTYRWSPSTGLSNVNIANPTATPAATTTYSLTVTDSLNATANDAVTVTVQAASALVANAGPDQTIAPGGSVVLSGSATGGTAPYTYRWSPTTGLNNANVASPTASPSATTTYMLTVTDSQSRTASDSAVATVTTATTGNTYYVAKNATNASDTNPGTEASPWKTLTKAGNTAGAGDIVYVKAGTYYETLSPARSGTAGSPITFRSYPSHRPTIDGQFSRANNVFLSGKSYIRVEGFELIGSVSHCVVMVGDRLEVVGNLIHDNVPSQAAEDAGIGFGWGDGMLIEGNEIFENGGNGLLGFGTSNTRNFTIRNNRIHHNGKDGMIDGSGSNWVIEYNWIHDHTSALTHSDSLQIQRPVDGLIIRYNRFWNSTQHIYIIDDVATGLFRNIQIYGNEIYHDPSTYTFAYPKGIFLSGTTNASRFENVQIFNNTIVGCYFGILLNESARGTFTGEIVVRNNVLVGLSQFLTKDTLLDWDTDHNCFFKRGAEGSINWNGTFFSTLAGFRAAYPTKDQQSIAVDPEFVDPAALNHRIKSTSPCINAGDSDLESAVSVPSPFTDIDGATRPASSGIDLGAYEWHSP